MPSLVQGKRIKLADVVRFLACFSVFTYIVSAIAFELTPETAIISTLAIYLVFAVGLLYVIQNRFLVLNAYVGLLVAFCMFVYIRTLAPNAYSSIGDRTAYLELTCVIACLLVFWMSTCYKNMLSLAVIAYPVGAFILAGRIVSEYGGFAALFDLAKTNGEEVRVGSLLGNANSIGLFLANGVLCSLVLFIQSKKTPIKLLTAAAMLAFGGMILLTASRKSLVFALLGVLMILYFYYKKDRFSKKAFVLVAVCAVLALVYLAITTLPMFSTVNERFEMLFKVFFEGDTSYDTDQTRKNMIAVGIEAFFEKPLFGHGTGYSYTLFGTYSHNNFVEILMCYGLVGFVLYYTPYVILIFKLFQRAKQRDIYATYFLAYTLVQILLGVGIVNYYSRSAQLITALAFGYLSAIKCKNVETAGKK